MPQGRRSYSRGAKRGPKNQVWTAVLSTGSAVSSVSTTQFEIVNQADWSAGKAGLERATLLSIRGEIECRTTSASVGPMFLVICKADETFVMDPATASEYENADILWTGVFQNPAEAAILKGFKFDIKAMRRITNKDKIVLYMTSVGSASFSVSGIIRGLVRVGGN